MKRIKHTKLDFTSLSFQVILKILNEYTIVVVCPCITFDGYPISYLQNFKFCTFSLLSEKNMVVSIFYGRFVFDRTRKPFQLYKNFKWFGNYSYLPKKIYWMDCKLYNIPKISHILSLLENSKRINILNNDCHSIIVEKKEGSDEITFIAFSNNEDDLPLNEDCYPYWIKDFVLKNEKIKWLILYMGSRNYERKQIKELNEYTENAFVLNSPPGRCWSTVIIYKCDSNDKRIKVEVEGNRKEIELYTEQVKITIDCDIFRNKVYN